MNEPARRPMRVSWRRFPYRLSEVGGRPWALQRGAWLLMLTLVVACGDGAELAPPKPLPDRELYWSLELNHHAITMSTVAPYNVLQLDATPRNPFGEVLPDIGTPTFTSPDHDRLLVSPTGELTAVGSTNGEMVPVMATLTVGNVRHVDTAYVQVDDNASPPVLTSFSIHPVPPLDSAKVSHASAGFLAGLNIPNVRALDQNGDSIPNLPVYLRSSDPTVLRVPNDETGPSRFFTGVGLGTATLYASTTAYGVIRADTVLYRVGWPAAASVRVNFGSGAPPSFARATTKIGVGGSVTWTVNAPMSSDPADITFEDADLPNIAPVTAWGALNYAVRTVSIAFNSPISPSMLLELFVCGPGTDCVGSGNITSLASSGVPGSSLAAVRVFLAPGTYKYRSLRYGISGQVVVVDERQ